MKIAGYLQTSLLDWPGKISSIIWTEGCNLRCPFCHNKNLVDPKNKADKYIAIDHIIKDLKSRKKWIDGLVISGGEPTIQSDLIEFCKKVKSIGLEIKIDTNGTNPEVLKKLIDKKLVDCIAMDLKTEFSEYNKATGLKIDVLKIKKSIELILNFGLEYEFRTTLVPTIHNKENLFKLAEELKEMVGDKNLIWFLQNFQPKNCLDSSFEKLSGFKIKEMKDFQRRIKEILPGVKIR